MGLLVRHLFGPAMLALFSGTLIAAPFAYITEQGGSSVSIIDGATDTVVATVPVLPYPIGVAASAQGNRVYVVDAASARLSVIDATSNVVITTLPVGAYPYGVAVNPSGTRAYVTNRSIAVPTLSPTDSVSVVDTATNLAIATVHLGFGSDPVGIAVHPDGSRVYVTCVGSKSISVIDTTTNAVSATVGVGFNPIGVAVHPQGSHVYVANNGDSSISVIDTGTNSVTATIATGPSIGPIGIAANPSGTRVYATLQAGGVVVIDTALNSVITKIPVGSAPVGISVNPSGTRVYVANFASNTVSVIDTATNAVVTTITGFNAPLAFGQFFGPPAGKAQAGVAVPTLSDWSLLALSLFLAVSGAYRALSARTSLRHHQYS